MNILFSAGSQSAKRLPPDRGARKDLGRFAQHCEQSCRAGIRAICSKAIQQLSLHPVANRPAGFAKWGIEGFIESVAQEVAPFGIEFTIAEPGPAKTGLGAGLVSPPALPAYEATPVGDVRRAVETGSFKLIGDAAKIAAAMIASAERSPAPRRVVMGRTSYVAIRAALENRIVELDTQKELALSTDSN